MYLFSFLPLFILFVILFVFLSSSPPPLPPPHTYSNMHCPQVTCKHEDLTHLHSTLSCMHRNT